jgi:KaiC/GvpD/RAD55 family RecA-like ATPase
MTILEQVKYFEAQGIYCVPVPVGKKQPVAKHLGKFDSDGKPIYEWKNVTWTEKDFLDAKAFGIDHEKSNIIDVDFDDLNAIKFQHLLPPDTLVIGKIENGIKYPTHFFYRYDGLKKTIKLLEDRGKKDSVIVEVLTNTQTVAGGGNRIVINNVSPKKLSDTEYSELIKTVRKISLMTMLAKHYPKQGGRDDYCLIIAGCLARYVDWPTHEKEDFLKKILDVVGDDEIKSRLDKISYQEEQLKLGKEVFGIESFSKELNLDKAICINWWNWINNKELSETTPITALSAADFISREYPAAEYLLFPLVSKETITQIWASPGVGKTLFSMELACALANGEGFLKYKWHENSKPVPVCYVEAEMSARQLQERLLNITQRYQNEGKKFNFDLLKFAILREQLNHSFDPLNTDLGRKRLELQLEQISQQHGQKPVVFLDNVSCLTNFQEKDGEAWISFMNFLIQLRSKGYTVFFLHHATKEGSTSSGSNMKERSVDLEIKLSEPDKDQRLDLKDETQIVIQFKKWREFNYTEHSKSFLASVARHTSKWSWHELNNKKTTQKEIAFKYWYEDQKIGIWSEDMKEHEEHSISKAMFYRFKKQQQTTNEEVPF